MGENTLFFYGTLLAPEMLHRVIHGSATPEKWQKDLLHFRPAVLHGYRRHRVRYADYPGIIPVPTSEDVSGPTTTNTAAGARKTSPGSSGSVLGTVVSGLTDGDVRRLDIYEGDEYSREKVQVRILKDALGGGNGSGSGVDDPERHLKDVLEAVGKEFTDEGEEVEAETYVWISEWSRLQDQEWDFEAFKKDKMKWWLTADERDW
ncbi:gamma-glutamylcyclotransferase family protein [Aspergillus lucknowensis]|uniref:Putative gamma-glutamylcyclotransferase n=1 Tax=Aspergillus lucknowensis TaxID=176173 RepID=A0ABR4LFS6_9EURO